MVEISSFYQILRVKHHLVVVAVIAVTAVTAVIALIVGIEMPVVLDMIGVVAAIAGIVFAMNAGTLATSGSTALAVI